MKIFVDSHCHLDYPDFADVGVDIITERARLCGVGHFLTICTEISKFPRVLATAERSSFIHCTVGTHPHHAKEEVNVTKEEIVKLTQNSKVVGIGETGLDYHYEHSPPEEQQKTFITHVEAALETDLPLVIHTREADEDTIRILKDVGQGRARGVFHCFSGDKKLADAALELGFYISFSGIITFKNADDLREVVKHVPLGQMLIETDAPYLAPEPNRGKRNEPSFMIRTAEKVAELKEISPENLAFRTTDNFFELFNKAQPVGMP